MHMPLGKKGEPRPAWGVDPPSIDHFLRLLLLQSPHAEYRIICVYTKKQKNNKMQALTSLFSLENRTALVTGGTRGIGAQMAIALAEAGADIVLVQVSSLMHISNMIKLLNAEKKKTEGHLQPTDKTTHRVPRP